MFSTVSPEGRIHSVPVWYEFEGGSFRVLTGRRSVKHRNLQHNPRASMCIDDGRFGYVSAEGAVQIEDRVTRDERLALHTRYRGPRDAAAVVSLGGHEAMVRIVLRPDHWITSW
ncbi:MAG: pyridoxamine 5'-phosphate oxidase family protein [Chloroflexi bacterium]|nr:pyridoxamine 5'-phosphate oxidase family protein [Chloroflexota bacterium]